MEHENDGKDGRAANGSLESESSGEKAQCDDCCKVWAVEELDEYRDFWSRVEPGNEIPAGDCPECGAFAYIIREPNKPARIVVAIRGGVVQSVRQPRGVEVVVKDYDNCAECGGTRCDGGFRAAEVHARRQR